jgi:hypothetical protein
MVPAPQMNDEGLDHNFPYSQPRTSLHAHVIPLVSPTGLSHSMPRPKSPRYPDRKGFSTGPGLLSAQYFHNTASENQQVPPVLVTEERMQHEHEQQQGQQYPRNSRTRSRDRIGRFQEGCNVETPERMETCTTQSARQSREFARRVKPVAQDSFRGCVRESIYVGRRMTECLAFTSDIYQQECSNNHRHRGDDSMFFASDEAKNFARRAESVSLDDPDDNSMALTESDGTPTRPIASSARKGRSPSRNGTATPKKDNSSYRKSKSPSGYRNSKSPGERDYGYPSESAERKSSPIPKNNAQRRVSLIESDYEISASPSRNRRSPTRESRELAPSESDFGQPSEVTESTLFTFTPPRKSKSPIPMKKSPSQRNEPVRTPRAVEADEDAPYRSNKGIRYPEAPKIMDSSFTTDPPTPERDHLRRPRGAYDVDDSFELSEQPLLTMRQPGTEYTDMRDLRMCMFVQDENNEKVVPEARFSRTLEQLEIQDGSIKKLETELRESKNALDRSRHELTLTRKASAQQKQVGTATAEKLFGDRVDIEEKLRREMRENDKLLEQISGLQDEKARLTTSLEVGSVGQVEVTRLPDESMVPTLSTSPSDEQNPQCPVTEEGLQESADRSMYFSSLVISLRAEIVELKCELAEAEAAQLATKQSEREIEDGNVHVRAEGEKLKEQVEQLKQEIEVMEQQASQKKREGELEIQQLQAQLKWMQEKLVTTAQDVLSRCEEHQTIEKVLNETQDEATKLRQQVASLISKVESLEVQSDSRNKVSVEEAKKIQGETSALKEKLSKSHREIIDQAAEHLKERQRMEEALWQSQQEAHALQSKVVTLDDQVAAAEDETRQLRMLMEEDDKASRATDASRSSQIVRYMNRKMASADSSVMEMFRSRDVSVVPDSRYHTN